MRADRLLPLVVFAAFMAAPVAAQVTGGGGAPPTAQQNAGGSRIWAPSPNQQLSRFEREEQARRLSMTDEEVEAEYGAERMELANRVAALVEQGQCREARAMANEAGERQMALRVRQTCRAR
ncbi:hypothetical protein N0B44_25110 [Roseibacterium beibuensis]|uniref:hypothetical protein n=1 Tax=[Roseibacterium] beibuensis TaxID=1193142 RepID=UPI00217DCF13|nr:hypothetical protein [Roseibacterium beibuensis]MCS6626202.1 hypothetical protein [Roseibacterium beibuensis]